MEKRNFELKDRENEDDRIGFWRKAITRLRKLHIIVAANKRTTNRPTRPTFLFYIEFSTFAKSTAVFCFLYFAFVLLTVLSCRSSQVLLLQLPISTLSIFLLLKSHHYCHSSLCTSSLIIRCDWWMWLCLCVCEHYVMRFFFAFANNDDNNNGHSLSNKTQYRVELISNLCSAQKREKNSLKIQCKNIARTIS